MRFFIKVLRTDVLDLGGKMPRFYGVAWPMTDYDAWVCAPVPFNKIAGFFRRLWFAMRSPFPNKWDKEMARLRGQLKQAEWAVARIKETEELGQTLQLKALHLEQTEASYREALEKIYADVQEPVVKRSEGYEG